MLNVLDAFILHSQLGARWSADLLGAAGRNLRAAAIRFGMGKLSGGTGEIAISIRIGRVRGRDVASGWLLEFLVEFRVGLRELRQCG
jgi:hypothetical protein